MKQIFTYTVGALIALTMLVATAGAQATEDNGRDYSVPGWPVIWTPLQKAHTGSWWSQDWTGGGATIQVLEVEPNVHLALIYVHAFNHNNKPVWTVSQSLVRDAFRAADPYPYYEFAAYLVDGVNQPAASVGTLRLITIDGSMHIELLTGLQFPPHGYDYEDLPKGISYRFEVLTKVIPEELKTCSWYGMAYSSLTSDCLNSGPRIPSAP